MARVPSVGALTLTTDNKQKSDKGSTLGLGATDSTKNRFEGYLEERD